MTTSWVSGHRDRPGLGDWVPAWSPSCRTAKAAAISRDPPSKTAVEPHSPVKRRQGLHTFRPMKLQDFGRPPADHRCKPGCAVARSATQSWLPDHSLFDTYIEVIVAPRSSRTGPSRLGWGDFGHTWRIPACKRRTLQVPGPSRNEGVSVLRCPLPLCRTGPGFSGRRASHVRRLKC